MNFEGLLFGSVATLASIRQFERRAYNMTFAGFDLDWIWEEAIFPRLMARPGGPDRIASYALDAGDTVDAAAIHDTKDSLLRTLIERDGLTPRSGLFNLLRQADDLRIPTAFCPAAPAAQVTAVLSALSPLITRGKFDWIDAGGVPAADGGMVPNFADGLRCFGITADRALAIVAHPDEARAASELGMAVVGVADDQEMAAAFDPGTRVVADLGPALLQRDAIMAAE